MKIEFNTNTPEIFKATLDGLLGAGIICVSGPSETIIEAYPSNTVEAIKAVKIVDAVRMHFLTRM